MVGNSEKNLLSARWLRSNHTISPFVSWHLFLISYRCHTVQVKLTDRNTETFLTQSPSITNLILKTSLAGRRERWEIGSEGEQRTWDLWKSSAGLFVPEASSEELFNSLPFFFCLEISKWNIECAEWVLLLQDEWWVYPNNFGVLLNKNHPKNSSDWF